MKYYSDKLFLILFTYLLSLFFIPLHALQKERLILFLQEYNLSENKCNGKVAYAIENGFIDVAEFLLLKGESINRYNETYLCSDEVYKRGLASHVRNTYIKHPLITAIRKNYKNLAILMIQMGVVNSAEELKLEYYNTYAQREIEHKNAMYVAIESDDSYEIVLGLLSAGFDPNTSQALTKSGSTNYYLQDHSIYTTPLLKAIEMKKLNIAELLLNYGADIEKTSGSYSYWRPPGYSTNFYGTPLLKAVDDNFIEGVTFLLNYGANPISESFNALDLAIKKGYWDIVDILSSVAVRDKKQ